MFWSSLPHLGSALILLIMAAATYTFVVSLRAGTTGSVRTLQAARTGAYGTVTLVAVTVLALAYAFVSHDFRIRYVAHYSDRSMPLPYLFTALWGGQDGSILWWLFLLSLYVGACVKWLGKKYVELQPYVIATFMAVFLFFTMLMAFAANPFGTAIGGAKVDGEGLNPLLQNFYMIIHPPSLYTGFVGCTVPFAFAVAALVTGRLDTEWIKASRKWMLFAWMFLSIGNVLGMLWAYEELGWGGYWAWDPVENAAFMPWLVATAYLHSVMIQERRGLFKVWNFALVTFTFFMTIFGTFLTRSGMIASVHSFAQSSIGTYFVGALGVIFVAVLSLILYRWPELRGYPKEPRVRNAALGAGLVVVLLLGPGLWALSFVLTGNKVLYALPIVAAFALFAAVELVFRRMSGGARPAANEPRIESLASREFTFVMNNWALLTFLLFVLAGTTWPLFSEKFLGEKVSVGPPMYNQLIQPLALIIYILMGVGTLFGWKKTSADAFKKMAVAPVVAAIVVAALHVALGARFGYGAFVWSPAVYPGAFGSFFRALNAVSPLLGTSVAAFNAAIVIQEFVILIKARIKSGSNTTPMALFYAGGIFGIVHTLFTLPTTGRRRYGGYTIHFALVVMLLGFTGQSWNRSEEASLAPGQSMEVEDYRLEYQKPRMDVDAEKRAVSAEVNVYKKGKFVGSVDPAKYIYKKMPGNPTTEVRMLHSIRDDLYVIVGSINPQTKVAALQVHVNPLVSWIWLGCLILMFGSAVCLWPDPRTDESRVFRFARGMAATAAATFFGILLATLPVNAYAQGSSLHSGTVKIENDKEREIFTSLRCMCGTCARDLLSTCACGTAEEARARIRAKMEAGETKDQIVLAYKAQYGVEALSVPPNEGAQRGIYLVPAVTAVAATVAVGVMLRRWKTAPKPAEPAKANGKADTDKSDKLDARLDDELSNLDE
jgi:cytochrome c-type biogenesis protein CcmF